MTVRAPAELPNEKPVGPARQYSTAKIPSHGIQALTLEEQATEVMDRVEDELTHKCNIDHVRDRHGNSPYKGRSHGFRLCNTKESRDTTNVENSAAPLKAAQSGW